MAFWTVLASVTGRMLVTVEADTVEQARVKFSHGDWVEEGEEETIDWEVLGEFKKDKE